MFGYANSVDRRATILSSARKMTLLILLYCNFELNINFFLNTSLEMNNNALLCGKSYLFQDNVLLALQFFLQFCIVYSVSNITYMTFLMNINQQK